MELHPLCTLFPRLADHDHAALVADIRANGLREPITVHDGMILDGGNRYRACVEAGIDPRFAEFNGPSIGVFVLSANLHRRHLSPGQQAAIVASVSDWSTAHPAHRVTDEERHVSPFKTVADRATTSGASRRTQQRADKVARARPDLAVKVGHGAVSLPAALREVEGKPAKRDEGPTAAELLDEMHADVRAAEARADQAEAIAREMEDAMAGDDAKAKLSALIRRVDHADRRHAEVMRDAAKAKQSADWHMRQLARCGKAVGERDLDKVASAVEAMARKAKGNAC